MKMENKKRVKVAKEGEREREREEVYESTKVKLTTREAEDRRAA